MQTSDQPEDMPHATAVCESCQKEFNAIIVFSPFDASKELFRQRRCDPCIESRNRAEAAAEDERRRAVLNSRISEDWWKICPKEFQTIEEGGVTDAQRLSSSVPQFDRIVSHPLGDRGLIIRGESGAGKTRCMYRLFRAYFDKTPRPKLIALSSGQFDRQARDAAGTFMLSQWFDKLARADALFVDDLGKGKWTASTTAQFWELLDDRMRNRKPLFFTTNLNGETLVSSLGIDKDIAEPLLRRIRETCDAVVLNQKQTK